MKENLWKTISHALGAFPKALILFLLLAAVSAQSQVNAAVYCVGPSATGDGSGLDWADLKAWSSTPARGDTWYLVAGNYSAKTFNTAASGTTLITILKATAANYANVTTSGWNSAMAGQAVFSPTIYFTTSYWVFDGVSGGLWDANPADYGFSFGSGVYTAIQLGVSTENLSDITLAHVYAKCGSSDTARYFIVTSGQISSANNVTVSNNCADSWQVFTLTASPKSSAFNNWVIECNLVLNVWGSSANHGSSIDADYGDLDNPIIRYNTWRGHISTAVTSIIEANNSNINGAQIYGNIFDNVYGSDDIVGGTSAGAMNNSVVYNNTFLSCVGGAWISGGFAGNTGSGNIAYNNLVYNMSGSVGSAFTHDYNAYFSASSVPSESHGQTGSGDPFNNDAGYDYTLKANTQAGINVGAPYNVDAFGNIRNTWTCGAIEFEQAGGGDPAISVTPGSVTFGTVLIGTSVTNSITVKNAGGGTLSGAASVSAPFSIVTGGIYNLGSNQSQTVTMVFSPDVASNFVHSVTFTGGGGTNAAVTGSATTIFLAVQLGITPTRQIILTVTGVIGRTYNIQATQDFKNWTVIGTVTVGISGWANFTDTNAASFSRRFYRIQE